MSRKLTEQEKNPHSSLVEVRNAIEATLDGNKCRSQAAAIANELTHEQCDKIVAADGDIAKIKAAMKPAEQKVVEKKTEQADKSSAKKK